MKRIISQVLLLLALAVGGFFAYQWLYPSPEKVIRKRLTELAEIVSFSGNETPVSRMLNVERLRSYLTHEVQVNVDVPGQGNTSIRGRDEVLSTALAVRGTVGSLKVDFMDATISVGPERQSATANLTVRAQTGIDKGTHVEEVKVDWRKVESKWLIERAETVKVLSE
jgi:hypothetical protein